MTMLSIISPVYGCTTCIEELHSRLSATLQKTDLKYEIILVDDRGPDDAWPLITELAKKDPALRGIRLTRNHGQQLAIWAGLEVAKGDWVVVLDCDLQDQPEIIPHLHDHATKHDLDAVVVERGTWSDNRWRRACSKAFYSMLKLMSGFSSLENIGNFGIYSRRLVEDLLQFQDKEIFFPIMVIITGYPRGTYKLDRAKRSAGNSTYNFARLMHLAMSVVVRFSSRPLALSVALGLTLSILSFLVAVAVFVTWFLGVASMPGWASSILSIWFIGGLILLVLGLHGIYVGRIFKEVQNRPRIFLLSDTEQPKKCVDTQTKKKQV